MRGHPDVYRHTDDGLRGQWCAGPAQSVMLAELSDAWSMWGIIAEIAAAAVGAVALVFVAFGYFHERDRADEAREDAKQSRLLSPSGRSTRPNRSAGSPRVLWQFRSDKRRWSSPPTSQSFERSDRWHPSANSQHLSGPSRTLGRVEPKMCRSDRRT